MRRDTHTCTGKTRTIILPKSLFGQLIPTLLPNICGEEKKHKNQSRLHFFIITSWWLLLIFIIIVVIVVLRDSAAASTASLSAFFFASSCAFSKALSLLHFSTN